MPKKLLVYGSSYAEEFVDAQGFGWEKAEPRFDWNHLVTSKVQLSHSALTFSDLP